MKILIFDYDEPILHILNREFLKLGHESHLVKEQPFLKKTIETAIEEKKPDIVLVTNFDHTSFSAEPRALEDILLKKGIPAVSWFFESPTLSGGTQVLGDWHRNQYPKNFHIVTADTHYIDFFKSRGLGTSYLPMGFDGTSVKSSYNKWQISDEPFLFWSGACLSGGLEEQLDDDEMRDYFVYWTIMDLQDIKGQKFGEEAEQKFFHDLNSLFSLNNYFDRYYRDSREAWTKTNLDLFPDEVGKNFWQVVTGRIDLMFSWYQTTQALRSLNSKIPLLAHGSDEWNLLIPNLRTPALRLSRDELFQGYAKHFASLCLTKQTFYNFIHEKVWAIFANGGFPFVDERADLWQFFKKGELAVYSDLEEIPSMFQFYLKNPEIREKMILKGQGMVLKDHTYAVRATQLIDIFKTLY